MAQLSSIEELLKKITWHAQASINIKTDSLNIYMDPYNVDTDSADIIFITHSHHDHLSIEDILKIANNDTWFICPEDCVKTIKEKGFQNIQVSKPGDHKTVLGLAYNAVPAYNVDKTQFHPKENNWLGYILLVDGIKIYHPGDTERIPEMKKIDCDLAFMPLGQTYTMNSVKEATQAVLDVKAECVIPFHYGMYEGTKEDAEAFKEMLKDKVKVVLLEPKGIKK